MDNDNSSPDRRCRWVLINKFSSTIGLITGVVAVKRSSVRSRVKHEVRTLINICHTKKIDTEETKFFQLSKLDTQTFNGKNYILDTKTFLTNLFFRIIGSCASIINEFPGKWSNEGHIKHTYHSIWKKHSTFETWFSWKSRTLVSHAIRFVTELGLIVGC